jgi:hypothetical protein
LSPLKVQPVIARKPTRRPGAHPEKKKKKREREIVALRHMTVRVGKVLPRPTSREAMLKIAYAIARFMDSKRAYKTEQNPNDVLFTIKRVTTPGLGEQIQLHLRFKGFDRLYGGSDTLDVDLYVPAGEWMKVHPALWPTTKSGQQAMDRSLDVFRGESSSS